jgi:hypothetical protein
MFTANTQVDLVTVNDKLAAVEASIAEAETLLPPVALREALGRQEPGDEELAPRIRDLHAERDKLTLALSEADRLEQARLAEARAKEKEARNRACSQAVGRLEKSTAKLSSIAEAFANEYGRLLEDSRSLLALLPPQIVRSGLPDTSFSPKQIRRLAELELHRLTRSASMPLFFGRSPWTRDHEDGHGGIFPITKILGARLDAVKRERLRAQPPAAVLAFPHRPDAPMVPNPYGANATHSAALPTGAADTAAAESDAPARSAAAPLPRKVAPPLDGVVDLRGRDLGVPKTGEPDVLSEEPAYV